MYVCVQRRRLNDWVVHYWAKVSLLLSLCRPTLLGRANLPPSDQVVVYVPNHTSYFDILLLSGFVPRPFKYLSKSEILDIPFVGAVRPITLPPTLTLPLPLPLPLPIGERERLR